MPWLRARNYRRPMNSSYKKRAVNLGFGIGVAFVVAGLLVIWIGSIALSGVATALVVVGLLAAVIGFVFALVPARDQP